MAEVNVSEKIPNYAPCTPTISTSFILFNLHGTRAHQPDFRTPKQIRTHYHDLFVNHYQLFRTSLPLSFTLSWECSQNKILGLRREGRTQDWLSLKRDSCPGLGRMTFRKVSAHSTAQSVSPSIE